MTTIKKTDQDKDILLHLQLIVGHTCVIVGDLMYPYLEESRHRFVGKARCIVLPQTVTQVSEIMILCRHHKIPVVCQGGNTGRNLAAQANDIKAIVLNLKYLNKIRGIDVFNQVITVEAGCVLADIKQYALYHDLFFPLTIGAETACQIGGNLATNAGGMNVLRYGNTRDLVLGIEAVTSGGEVIHELHSLYKNNTGYDIKNLLIGSEGTLAVITAATLRLFPREVLNVHGFVGLNTINDAVYLLKILQKKFNGLVSCFELIPAIAIDFLEQVSIKNPLSQKSPWYVWYRLADTKENEALERDHLLFLESLLEQEILIDATVSQNQTMENHFIKMREVLVEQGNQYGAVLKFDIALPISQISLFFEQSKIILESICPHLRFYPFGHLGDGNIHFNIIRPESMTDDEFLANYQDKLTIVIYDLVDSLSGTFSAEHGIGRLKRLQMARYKDPITLGIMRRIKHALDPMNIMNPDQVLPSLEMLEDQREDSLNCSHDSNSG